MNGKIVTALVLASMTAKAAEKPEAKLQKMVAQFQPVELAVDLGALPASEQKALAKLVEAAKIMDALFLRQSWAGNETMLLDLLKDDSAVGKARLHGFLLYRGPWDRVNHLQPFVPGAPAKPAEGNFYPAGATKADVEKWQKGLSEAERAKATGFFTTIRKGSDGKFVIVPYSLEYQGELARAAALLREAAALTQQPTLKAFLEKRAAAFVSNDYYDSDLAWMQLDSTIEPTIGPYEVYEDEWFNAKAAFEAFITVRDDVETKKLEKFAGELQGIEDHLPIDPKLRNPKIGALAPIRVVNEIFASGDANHGVQTAAFNLPNDERITKEKGTKRVMLKNVQEAKFKGVLTPIVKVALGKPAQKSVAFDAFFTHILMHELMHGLGPHDITVAGKKTTVRQALEDSYSAIEEAKADATGLWAMQYLVDKGVIAKEMEGTMYVTYLASAFRSIRFGVNEAHGKGMALQINYLMDAGGFVKEKDGTFAVDGGKIKKAVEGLAHDLLAMEASGDKAAAKAWLAKMGVVRPEVQQILDRLQGVPVDIEPRFTTAEKLLQQ